MQIYRKAELPERKTILQLITLQLAPDYDALNRALGAMVGVQDPSKRACAEARLRVALESYRGRFFRLFNLLPEGVTFLVELRDDLLRLLTQEPSLEVLKIELDNLFASWFDPGSTELRRISWRSSALLLEKLIRYEAVHPIASWNDLKDRLDSDRRCYALFHPRMQDEPLIFVEIALLHGIPTSIQLLLDEKAPVLEPSKATTAVFYSISSAQRGLRGISFGNLLLKRTINVLRRELPQLNVFATLSPLPGFRKWLDQAVATGAVRLSDSEADGIARALGCEVEKVDLLAVLRTQTWTNDANLSEALRKSLERFCVHYLLVEKAGRQPLDAVAAFHLNNGAFVNHVVWLGDTSERGMRRSYGMMVSYRYDPEKIARNQEGLMRHGGISATQQVRRLLKHKTSRC